MDRGDPVMGVFAAIWGGFSSFFSIWQVCILQISPFFLAFILGLYLMANSQVADPRIRKWVFFPYLAYVAGFILFYSLLIASGLPIGRTLTYNIGDLRVVSGIVILCVSLYLIFADRITMLRKTGHIGLMIVASMLIGAAFAIIYSPCITPTLSEIMGMAARPETAVTGWLLALIYGLGLSLAFGVAGIGMILLLRRVELVRVKARLIKDICGVIVFVPGLLNITGLMVYYKAFFLGLLV